MEHAVDTERARALRERLARHAQRAGADAEAEAVVFERPAELAAFLRRLPLISHAVAADAEGEWSFRVEELIKWPEGIMFAQDLTWALTGEDRTRTLVVFGDDDIRERTTAGSGGTVAGGTSAAVPAHPGNLSRPET